MTKRTWLRVSEALRYFLVGALGIIPITDIIPPSTVKWLSFGIAMGILALKSADYAVKGQAPTELKAKPTID